MRFGNGQKSGDIAFAKSAHVAVEDQHCVLVVRTAVALLSGGQVHRLVGCHSRFSFPNKLLRFESLPNLFVDLMDLVPALGNDDCPMLGLQVPQITLSETPVLVGCRALLDDTLFVESVEGLRQFPITCLSYGLPVL